MNPSLTLTRDPSSDAVTVRGIRPDDVEAEAAGAMLAAASFEAEAAATIVTPTEGGFEILVGLGADDDRTADTFRTIGGAVARAGADHASLAVVDVLGAVPEDVRPIDAARALAEGIVLGAYRYDDEKSDPEAIALSAVEIVGTGGKRVQAALDQGGAIATGQCIGRDLVNEPGGSLTPTAFAKKIEKLGSAHNFEVTVLGPKEIKAAKMGGLLGVNRGSDQPPRFVELRWTPEGKAKGTVALVGKGVTFDSGGLSLKPTAGMLWMKGDMGGAAAVVGAFCALDATQPKVEVRGYLPLTDNMTGGDATRLGDVLRISNGTTVEVHNTDAEGRLILADALVRASAEGPDAIVDLATLTGACMAALGEEYAGLMSPTESWAEQAAAAGERSGEELWRLPLPGSWRKQLDSDIADIKNIGGKYGGASTAGLFLKEFVGDDIPWCHIDIAGTAWTETEDPVTRKGGTGYGVRLLVDLLRGYKKP